MISGDFNGDGKLDLAVANSLDNAVTLLIGQGGDLAFGTRLHYPTDPTPFTESIGVVTGDFNGDGIPDLAVLNCRFSSCFGGAPPFGVTISILLGRGHGLFQKPITFPAGPVFIFGLGFAAADFNGDGKLDLVVAGEEPFPGPSGVWVLLGNGDGTFQSPVLTPTPAGLRRNPVTTGDFNGDGRVDLAVITSHENCCSGTLSIFLGNGDGTFQTAASFPLGIFPNELAVGDFDRDGKLDVAVSQFVGATVAVLLGNGDGTLRPEVDYSTAPGIAMGILAVDLNHDGKLDLVTTGENAQVPGTVSVLLGNGDGTFQPHVDYSMPGFLENVIAGDFNGDGKLDLLSDGLFLLLGNGDGTFNPIVDSYLDFHGLQPSAVSSVAAGDFSGNGGLDLAAAIGFPDNQGVTVFLNTPVIAPFPSSVSFPKQVVGTRSGVKKVQLSNRGSVPLTIISVAASSDFAETNNCIGTLPVGAHCTVNVTFSPIGTGTRTGVLTVIDSTPTSPQTVTLSGVGIP